MIGFDPKGWRPCDACAEPEGCWKGNRSCSKSGEIRDRETGQWIALHLLAHLVHYRNQERLPMWTIYRPCPEAHSTYWTARLFWSLPEAAGTNFIMAASSLDGLRLGLPTGTYRLDRFKGDAPEIVESWM